MTRGISVESGRWLRKTKSAASARPMEQDDFVTLAKFRHALRQFLAFSDTATEAAGVTAQQYQAMLAIKARSDGAMSIKDLAEELILQHHGAVQLADRLEAAGLAQRRASDLDRRGVLLSLTPKGEALITDLAANHLRELLKRKPLLAYSLRQLRTIGP